MIEVTVDMVPGGDYTLRRNIGKIRIANMSNLADISDYRFALFDSDEEIETDGYVEKHERSLGIWPLLRRILDKL